MKPLLVIFIAILAHINTIGQSLFTYGSKTVSPDAFIKAFRKNSEPGKTGREDVIKYLDLYTNFKLKVQDAYDMRLDTVINKQEDIIAFRKQIEEQFLFDSTLANSLVEEAKVRGEKELRISHIFVPFREEFPFNPFIDIYVTPADSQKTIARINEAYAKLMKGEDFGKVAVEYSLDPSVKENKGDLGFITVFSLPYVLESAAYGLQNNEISKPFASSRGYHIFKKTGERPARGKLQLQQILLAFDPEGTEVEKRKVSRLADSLYTALKNGASFAALARTYSNDNLTAPDGGLMAPFSAGTYETAFEEKVFAIAKDGEMIPPIETSQAFHIVKRVKQLPVNSASFAGISWETAVGDDARKDLPKKRFAESTPILTGVKKKVFDFNELRRVTDSGIAMKKIYSPSFNDTSVLLEYPQRKVRMPEWLFFVSERSQAWNQQQFMNLWNAFVTQKSLDYYRDHLELYNNNFKEQLTDFKEGNLLFEAMERKIWSRSATDTQLQKKVYQSNRAKYNWERSADAIVFTVTDSASAAALRSEIIKDPTIWRSRMETSGGRIMADSSRLDWSLITPAELALKNGGATDVVVNSLDASASFAYIVKTYPKPEPKTFDQARGQVINDCQQILEEQWIASLKKKYPVKVNKAELENVIRQLAQ